MGFVSSAVVEGSRMPFPACPAMLSIVPTPLLTTLAPAAWAEATFGAAQLGDPRRTRRLVQTAAALAARPSASLPRQLEDPAALKATYRLLDADAISFDAVIGPHQEQTHVAGAAEPVVLLVQDTTTLDFSAHPATTGLGPISCGSGHGFHLQTVLAVRPDPRMPLGVLAAAPWLRQSAPPGETRTQRQRRSRESDVWGRLVQAVGRPPEGTCWVHVADRGADCFSFFTACQQTGAEVLVRVVQNRCVTQDDDPGHLVDVLRDQPAIAHRPLAIPARSAQPGRRARPARETEVAVSWTVLTLSPPTNVPRDQPTPAPIPVWAVRVWEERPDPSVAEPVEWLLVTTVPVQTVADAWERVDWYTTRWVIEDYHQCLKTGCRAEHTQLRDVANLWRRLGLLRPLAVRLLLLREASRQTPDAPATLLADAPTIRLVAARTHLPEATTVAAFTRQVARLGGHQGRKRDGPPGWRTLWRGWWTIQTLLEGAELAVALADP